MPVSFDDACSQLIPQLRNNFPTWQADAAALEAANLQEIRVPLDLPDTIAAWYVPFKKPWRRGLLSLVLVKAIEDGQEHIGLAWHLAFSSTSDSDPVVDFVFLEGLDAISLAQPFAARDVQDLVDAMLACAPAQVLTWTCRRLDALKTEHLVIAPS